MTGKDVLTRKGLLGKAATMKRFEYSPLGKELKKQSSVATKQNEKIKETFESKKNEETKQKAKKIHVVYNKYLSF